MKSLYESILKSVGSGKEKLSEDVRKWFFNTQWFKFRFQNPKYNFMHICINVENIEFTPMKNNSWKIDIKTKREGYFQSWQFNRVDTKGTGIMPFNIYSVCCDGKPVNITYNDIEFKSTDDIVQEVDKSLVFYGCDIKKLDKIPKGCEEITFGYSHRLGGGSGCKVGEINNITLKNFSILNSGREKLGLSCRLSNIKGLKITSRFEFCDYMLGYYCLEKGGRMFTQEASDMIDEFFKNNSVDPVKCMFISSENKIGYIVYDKKIKRWRFKPYLK